MPKSVTLSSQQISVLQMVKLLLYVKCLTHYGYISSQLIGFLTCLTQSTTPNVTTRSTQEVIDFCIIPFGINAQVWILNHSYRHACVRACVHAHVKRDRETHACTRTHTHTHPSQTFQQTTQEFGLMINPLYSLMFS
jgi:hypothetical protein